MPLPLVSIVINNYNYARFLDAAIRSALAQRGASVEVIVVDDGSTDDSRQVIAAYGAQVQAVLKPNGGQASAFNAGFAASRGELVMFLDADDMLLPDAAARVAAAWTPDAAKVQFRLQLVDRQGHPIAGQCPEADCPLLSGDLRGRILSGRHYPSPFTSGNAFARAALARILPIPEADWPITADCYVITLAPLFGPVISLPEALGLYRIHGDNHWAAGPDTAERRRWEREVEYTFKQANLVAEWAARLGERPAPHLAFQRFQPLRWMIALKLEAPSFRLPEERSLGWLARQAVRVLARETYPAWPKRLAFAAWFLLLAIAPRSLARRLLPWGLSPQSRPAWLSGLKGPWLRPAAGIGPERAG